MRGLQFSLIEGNETIFWPIDIAVGYDCDSGWICANCGEKYLERQFNYIPPRYCPQCGMLVQVLNDEGDSDE